MNTLIIYNNSTNIPKIQRAHYKQRDCPICRIDIKEEELEKVLLEEDMVLSAIKRYKKFINKYVNN